MTPQVTGQTGHSGAPQVRQVTVGHHRSGSVTVGYHRSDRSQCDTTGQTASQWGPQVRQRHNGAPQVRQVTVGHRRSDSVTVGTTGQTGHNGTTQVRQVTVGHHRSDGSQWGTTGQTASVISQKSAVCGQSSNVQGLDIALGNKYTESAGPMTDGPIVTDSRRVLWQART